MASISHTSSSLSIVCRRSKAASQAATIRLEQDARGLGDAETAVLGLLVAINKEGGDAGVDDVRQGKEGRLGARWLDVGGVDAVLLGHGEDEEGMVRSCSNDVLSGRRLG